MLTLKRDLVTTTGERINAGTLINDRHHWALELTSDNVVIVDFLKSLTMYSYYWAELADLLEALKPDTRDLEREIKAQQAILDNFEPDEAEIEEAYDSHINRMHGKTICIKLEDYDDIHILLSDLLQTYRRDAYLESLYKWLESVKKAGEFMVFKNYRLGSQRMADLQARLSREIDL